MVDRIEGPVDRLAERVRARHSDPVQRLRVPPAWAGGSAREVGGGRFRYDLALQRRIPGEEPE